MLNTSQFAEVGRLVGEPARAAMLMTLMDGRAFTAAELARAARITPQTASAHLGQLTSAGLLCMRKQGRHRYHALASAGVARMLEGIMEVASTTPRPERPLVTGPRDAAMRQARTCYDHFAGRLGVAIAEALVNQGAIELHDEAGMITERGMSLLHRFGIQLGDGGRPSARPLCRPCLDWSERRPHLGGKVGAAICAHFFARGLVRRIDDSRALTVTAGGRRALLEMYGIRSL
jgi:DNA-binding transcriptional ArsR family regulator